MFIPHSKKTQGLFYVGQLLLGMGLPWSVPDSPSDTLLEKMYFPFPSRYHPKLASWLGVGLVHFLFSGLGFSL